MGGRASSVFRLAYLFLLFGGLAFHSEKNRTAAAVNGCGYRIFYLKVRRI